MFRGLSILCVALALLVPVRADDDAPKAGPNLGVGDAAPKLALGDFVKGEPINGFEKGNIYVLEFWATWCGPCIAAIPHVTELQKQYPKVVFIGVNVWEQDVNKVKPFVEKMGEKMEYRVALDSGNSAQGAMARTWLAAAGQNGIPCSMIVDGNGKIAWIGHPMRMDQPLAKIVAGDWDLQAAATEFRKQREQAARMAGLNLKLRQALSKGNDDALRVIDEILDSDPDLEKQLGMMKFRLLEQMQKLDQQIDYGNRLIDKVFANDAMGINNFVWPLIDPERKTPADERLVRMALKGAQKADQLAGEKNAPIADTLARAYWLTGDKAKAIAAQGRAVELAKGTEMERELKERLEEYEKDR